MSTKNLPTPEDVLKYCRNHHLTMEETIQVLNKYAKMVEQHKKIKQNDKKEEKSMEQ